MKAILEFDLNDPYDRNDHLRAVHANDMANALFEITNIARRMIKKHENDSELDDEKFNLIVDIIEEFSEGISEELPENYGQLINNI